MSRLIKPPRGVFFAVGNGQGSFEIVQVAGTGLYFDFNFQLDDYFEYALESASLNVAETGVATITATTPNKGIASRAVVQSTQGVGQALNLQLGETYILLLKASDDKTVTEDPVTGRIAKPDPINKTVFVLNFNVLKTMTPPAGADVYFEVVYGTAVADGRGGIFEWVPGSAVAFDDPVADLDVNVIKNDNSVNGRFIRRNAAFILQQVATGAMPTGSFSREATTKDLRSYHPLYGEKIVPEVEQYDYGTWPTLTSLLAEASTYLDTSGAPQSRWPDGVYITVRGYAFEDDVVRPLRLKWVANDVDATAALGVTKWRPDDITGGNPGRWVVSQPNQQDKFIDNDSTPDVSGTDVGVVADIPPATGYTTFDGMRDGKFMLVRPGVKAGKFVHSAGFRMPGARDHWLLPGDPPLLFYKNNAIIEVLSVKPRQFVSTHVGDGTDIVVIDRLIDPTAFLVQIEGATILPSQIDSVTLDSPLDGQTSIDFGFNVTNVQTVLVFG